MTRFKTSRWVVPGVLSFAAGAALLPMGPSGAVLTGPQTGAYVTIAEGSTLEAGAFSVASADVSATGSTDSSIALVLTLGASDTLTLTMTPATDGTPTFGTGPESVDLQATADATHGGLTVARTSKTCTNPTGTLTLSSATYDGGNNLLTTALRFSVKCSEDTSATSAEGWAFVAQPVGPLGLPALSEFYSIDPVRLLDTRDTTKLTEAGSLDIDITKDRLNGNSGVPTTATAVVINVTGVAPDQDTFLTVFPKGSTRPVVSNLNPRLSDNVANLVTVKVGTGNMITLYNEKGTTDVVVDVVGFYQGTDATANTGDRFVPQTPMRKLDTRNTTAMTAGETRTLDLGITGTTAVLNVTVTRPTEGGYVAVFPEGLTTAPTVSNINFTKSQTIANMAVVKVTAGKVKIYNPAGTTDVIVDLLGEYVTDPDTGTAGQFAPIDPVRSYNSRDTGKQPMTDMETRNINLLALNGKYPFEYSSIVANMTVAETTALGFMTAFPAGVGRPEASNLNWAKGEIRPNMVVAGTDVDGFTSFYNEGGTVNVILDVAGFFTQ